MKTLQFTNIHLENFGKHSEAVGGKTISTKLGHRTVISGSNACGKSTIKRAIQYILGAKDENGKEISGIRPHDENGVDIDGLTTVAELTVSVDGQENTLKRTCFQEKNRQGEYTGKDNLQYFVDDAKKGTKKAYEEFIGDFLPNMVCVSAQEFLSKDTAGRRAMLEVFSEHNTDSIIAETPEFEPLRAKLKANTVADLKKACRDKIKTQTKERDAYPARIDELEKQKVDIDVAELELLKNSLNEQISENKAKQADISKQFEEYDKLPDGIMELQFELNDSERKANEELVKQKRKIEEEISSADMSVKQHSNTIILSNDKILNRKKDIERYEEKIKTCREEWKRVNDLAFGENSLVCSYCGQEYPEQKKEKLRAKFEREKTEDLARITENGNDLKARIENTKAEIEQLEKTVEIATKQKELAEKRSEELEQQLSELPQSIDISNREDVKSIKQQIAEKERAMKKANSGEEIRQQLQEESTDLQAQLMGVDAQLYAAQKNVELDERVAELQKEQLELSQKIADIERELDLLKQFERKKAELLEEDLNKNCEFIRFKMSELQQNGELKDICQILVNGESYDRNLNFSNRLLAEVDICRMFQRKYDVQLPILLDNAESVDNNRIPQVENQIIIFKRTDDKELKIECLEG